MPKRLAIIAILLLTASCAYAQSAAMEITEDTTWQGARTIDGPVRVKSGTLTIKPGSVVTFKDAGAIVLSRGAGISARGTAKNPIRFVAENTGQVRGVGNGLFEYVEVVGMGLADQHKRRWWLSVRTGEKGIVIRNCKVTNSGGVTIILSKGPFEITGSDFRGCTQGISVRGKQKALIEGNTLDGGNISTGGGIDAIMRGNVLIGGTITTWRVGKLLIEKNYVHQPRPKGTYGLSSTIGTIRDNVIRGGSWTTAYIGGEITGNVIISLPHEKYAKSPGAFDKNCTHEHICGLMPNSKVVRNIFVGASYGAIMGIGRGTCSDSTIRNNTFDMRGFGNAIYLNHLPKSNPKNIVIRSNIFMRTGAVLDEKGVADSVKEVDYNLWADAGLKKKRGRFVKMVITGKNEGDPGFGGNDVPKYSDPPKALVPTEVVVNPNVKFPFTDADMLSRKHTVDEIIAVYRKAYTPTATSAAIDAGSPADKTDPAVTDGKVDIGAVEHKAVQTGTARD